MRSSRRAASPWMNESSVECSPRVFVPSSLANSGWRIRYRSNSIAMMFIRWASGRKVSMARMTASTLGCPSMASKASVARAVILSERELMRSIMRASIEE